MMFRAEKALLPLLIVGLGVTTFGTADAAPARKAARKPAARKPAARKTAPRAAASSAGSGKLVKVTVNPPKVLLSGTGSSQRFLVLGEYADGRMRDLTASAKVSKGGQAGLKLDGNTVSALTNGTAKVVASVGGLSGEMAVTSQDVNAKADWSFANEIVPVFTKAGCNTGGCHGSPSGRGTFRLSLFGYEPVYDYQMLVLDKNGARVNRNQPSQSRFSPRRP
jgi:hypothetical protein